MFFLKGLRNLFLAFFEKKKIIFFYENSSSEIHLLNLIEKLNKDNFIIITSDKNINKKNFNFYNFYNNYFLILFFSFIKDKIVIMTTPDLNNFYLKRSNNNKYIYIHHSICSTNMIYNENAFDNYDYIFNVGQHHNKEIIEREKTYKIKKKILINYGYGKLDYLLNNKSIYKTNFYQACIAPSWNRSLQYLYLIDSLIEKLLPFIQVRFRPHKNSYKYHSKEIMKIIDKYCQNSNFILDLDDNSFDYLLHSKFFFTDWSGTAFEYAFLNLRKVIFLDTPMKINNKNYKEFENKPIELNIRDQIGLIIKKEEIKNVVKKIYSIDFDNKESIKWILKLREKYIFNLKQSSKSGIEVLNSIINEK